MGSFNVSCGISGASISSGERTGMVPIIPQKFKYVSKWFFGGCDRYIPVSPPIYGIYNDYGNLNNVEPSPIVDYLEQTYGMPIEIVLKCMQVDKPFDHEVVEYFYGKDSVLSVSPYSQLDDNVLLQLGFEKVDEPDALGKVWKFDDYMMTEGDKESNVRRASYVVSSINLDVFGAVENVTISASNVYDFVKHFHKATNRWVGLSKSDSEKFNNVRELVWMPFVPEVFENVVKHGLAMNTYMSSFDRLVEELPGAFERASDTSFGFSMPVSSVLNNKPDEVVRIEALGFRHLLNNSDSWLPIFQFADVMHSANKAYMPIVSGEQCGSPWTEKVIGEILLKRYESFRAEDDEYEDDDS